ncbi:Xaa-Pro dipeptidase [Glycine max]|nr:Xaa-Pro dipeptidase [Glycine max]
MRDEQRCRWSFMSKTGRSSSLPFVNTCPSLLVLLQDGEEQTRYDTDHLKLFMYPNPEPRHFNLSIPNSICFALRGQESFFAYFFGVIEPGFYAAIDVATGNSILFAPRLPSEYAVWLGVIKPLSYFKVTLPLPLINFLMDLHLDVVNTSWLARVASQIKLQVYCSIARVLGNLYCFSCMALNTDSDNYSKPADFQGIDKFDKDLTALHPILTECLSSSQSWKLLLFSMPMILALKLMLSCKRKVILGTWEVMRNTKAGMKEYQLESIFLHHTCMYGGCWHCSYTCICATGDNSAVLHYGHAAAPNDKIGDVTFLTCLVHSSYEKLHWAQRTIAVLWNMALFDMGAEYHFYGSDITCSLPVNGKFTSDQSLIYSISRKSDSGVTEEGTHFIGVITVEPGCYFIDALLLPAMNSPETSEFLNQEAINRFKCFGGVRIESDVCPREIQEIEAVMAGAPWPAKKTSTHVGNGLQILV